MACMHTAAAAGCVCIPRFEFARLSTLSICGRDDATVHNAMRSCNSCMVLHMPEATQIILQGYCQNQVLVSGTSQGTAHQQDL
jgi:hypothetical protein